MVVDDDSTSVNSLKIQLADGGLHRFVATGKSPVAIESIRQHQPNIILLDLKDLAESEVQILEDLRTDNQLAQIPLLVLTEQDDTEVRRQAFRRGAV